MRWKIRYLLLLLVLTLTAFGVRAQEFSVLEEAAELPDSPEPQRPVVGSYRLEIGRRHAYSTYLSPYSYRGTDFALSGFWTKVLPFNPDHCAMSFEGRVNYGRLLNPAGSASELDLHANFQAGCLWQQRFSGGWTVGAGGSLGFYGGVLYLLRNSNNPVSAQFAAGIGANGYASKLFTLGKLPILLSDRLSLPLVGGFFCQDYGEPFYEIYLGNHSNLAHFGWPGNRFGIDNLLSVTLDLGRTALEVGYRFSFQDEYANHLTTRITNHAFVIGIIPGGLGIKTRRNVITPLY